MTRRWLRLPDQGTLLVSTDLHGNGADFRRLRDLFLAQPRDPAPPHWVLLGDAVHAPGDEARRSDPELYDFPDESGAIVAGIAELRSRYPDTVHYVLGNHDYGHVGGPHTHKFHPDEVAHLEATLDAATLGTLRRLFSGALLAVVAPCGALLTHGSPNETLADLDDLNRIQFPPPPTDPYLRDLLDSFLGDYGQRGLVTDRLLAAASRCGVPLRFVVHGHDRDPAGVFVEGGNQICPVLFGAPREKKRYLLLDLAARYGSLAELREEHEIRRLYDW
jgi:hypothetical protein